MGAKRDVSQGIRGNGAEAMLDCLIGVAADLQEAYDQSTLEAVFQAAMKVHDGQESLPAVYVRFALRIDGGEEWVRRFFDEASLADPESHCRKWCLRDQRGVPQAAPYWIMAREKHRA